MSLRETFASNLKRLCAGKPSIAAVCRGTGINRQQFNRYLSGAALPNDKNLKKICTYFKIDEFALYRENLTSAARSDTKPPPNTDVEEAIKALGNERPTSVEPGLYFAHFAHPHDPTSIMRSVMVIRRDGNLSTFRRLTGWSERRGSWWSHFNGDHRGIIIERRHWLYFIALNSVGTNEPTQLVMRWIPNSDPILGGHASIMTPIGPTVTGVIVTRCPRGTSLRTAIKGSHVYSLDDPAIEPIILDSLEQQCQSLIGMVRRLDLEVTSIGTKPPS